MSFALENKELLASAAGSTAMKMVGGKDKAQTITVMHPRVNNGRPTNLPAVWGKESAPFQPGTPEHIDWVVQRAVKSGNEFQSFATPEEAAAARFTNGA